MTKSNDVLAADIKYIKETLDRVESYNKEKLGSIEKQAKLTNGRVGKLESWQSEIIGGAGVARFLWGTMGATLIGAMIYTFTVVSNFENIVAKAVREEIEELGVEL